LTINESGLNQTDIDLINKSQLDNDKSDVSDLIKELNLEEDENYILSKR
jgi:hypothetical protein